jgi:hypothetical protein
MAKFEFDDRALKKMVAQEVQRIADDLTRALNGLTPQYRGKPLAQIKQQVQRVWKQQTGENITDPELTTFAEQIQAGGRIEGQVRL